MSPHVFEKARRRLPSGVDRDCRERASQAAEVAGLRALGYRAFLIGERFMTDAGSRRGALRRSSTGPGQEAHVADARVKICGITRAEDAALAVGLGADAIGFVFWPASPRAVTAGRGGAAIDRMRCRLRGARRSVRQCAATPRCARGRAGEAARRRATARRRAAEDCRRVGAPADQGRDAGRRRRDVARPIALPADVTARRCVRSRAARRHGQAPTGAVQRSSATARPVILAGGLSARNVGDAIGRCGRGPSTCRPASKSAPGVKSPRTDGVLRTRLAGLRTESR